MAPTRLCNGGGGEVGAIHNHQPPVLGSSQLASYCQWFQTKAIKPDEPVGAHGRELPCNAPGCRDDCLAPAPALTVIGYPFFGTERPSLSAADGIEQRTTSETVRMDHMKVKSLKVKRAWKSFLTVVCSTRVLWSRDRKDAGDCRPEKQEMTLDNDFEA